MVCAHPESFFRNYASTHFVLHGLGKARLGWELGKPRNTRRKSHHVEEQTFAAPQKPQTDALFVCGENTYPILPVPGFSLQRKTDREIAQCTTQ